MAGKPLFQVRAPQRVHDVFEESVRRVQAQMAFGSISRGEVLEMAVNSLSATLASGQQLHGLQLERPPEKG